MTKNTKTVSLGIVGAVVVLVVFLFWTGRFTSKRIDCGDGPRQTIDLSEFATKYTAYNVEFEASVADKAKLGGKIEPRQLQQLSEALQQGNEFRKWLVAGYNGCAITKAQYAEYGSKFQAMDGLARQINSLAAKPDLSTTEEEQLSNLVKEYLTLSQTLKVAP